MTQIERAKKLFNDLLRVKNEKVQCQSQHDSEYRKTMPDRKAREHAAFAPDATVLAREEEERIARKLKDEIDRIRAMHSNKTSVLNVSWETIGKDYTSQRLREFFSEFCEVEDVEIKSSKKSSALVVMSFQDSAVLDTSNSKTQY